MLRAAIFVFALLLSLADSAQLCAAQSVARSAAAEAPQRDKKGEIVAFNVHTHKYHCARCPAAKRCTANCISISISDAKARGGVACKICGGSCQY